MTIDQHVPVRTKMRTRPLIAQPPEQFLPSAVISVPAPANGRARARVMSIVPSDPLRSAATLWTMCLVALLTLSLGTWILLDGLGVMSRVEEFVGEMLGAERFAFSTGAVMVVLAALSVIGASLVTLIAGGLLLVTNAVARLSGGVVVDLAEQS